MELGWEEACPGLCVSEVPPLPNPGPPFLAPGLRGLCPPVLACGASVRPGGCWHLGRRGGPITGTGEPFIREEKGGSHRPGSPSLSPSPCAEKASTLAPTLGHADLQEASGMSPTQPPPLVHFRYSPSAQLLPIPAGISDPGPLQEKRESWA